MPLLTPQCLNLAQETLGQYLCSRFSWSQIKGTWSFGNKGFLVGWSIPARESKHVPSRCNILLDSASKRKGLQNWLIWAIFIWWKGKWQIGPITLKFTLPCSLPNLDSKHMDAQTWLCDVCELFVFKKMSSECIKPSKVIYFLCSQKWPVLAKFSKKVRLTWFPAWRISAQQLTFGKVTSSWKQGLIIEIVRKSY